MKRKYIYLALTGLMLGCKKEGLVPYEFGSAVSIYKSAIEGGTDSLTRSFAILKEEITLDTIVLPLRIVGQSSSNERTVGYEIIAEKTTAGPIDYELLPAQIPAHSYEGSLRIVLKRSESLKKQEKQIGIRLTKSTDFQVGPIELSSYLIKFNDYLTKPTSWDQIRFGDYSQVKYSLIIRETGYFDFSGLRPEVLLYIVGKSRNVLNSYLQSNGTEMLDEQHVPVRFP